MSDTFTWNYSFTLNGFADTVVVTTGQTPAGGPYSVTSISGTAGGNPITGINGNYAGGDNVEGSGNGFFNGVDNGGISFDTVNDSYNLFSSANNLYVTDLNNDSVFVQASFSTTACYVQGTHIATADGDVPVEALAIGDILLTAGGELRPIKWIGLRGYAGRFLAANPQMQPIRLRAGCLGEGMPRRDLLVSPKHAMFLDGVLVPAGCLVNGTTITQERVRDRVDYFHIELDSHDVILAEGAPSESFLDDDSRGLFHNAAEYAALYPNVASEPAFCAPRVECGLELETIRRRLAKVAGLETLAA